MKDKLLKDHKQIGQKQELFFTDEVAPGAPFWLPKGMVIFKELEKYIRQLTEDAGYLETSTPIMVKSEIFRQSGHFEKFGAHNMFNLSVYEDNEIAEIWNEIQNQKAAIQKKANKSGESMFEYEIKIGEIIYKPLIIVNDKSTGEFTYTLPFNYSIKPMNCPESTVLYRFRPRSYRELPIRFSEIGRLLRREKAGEIGGLLRVRQLTMDDAHIYATEDQIYDEVSNILDMMISFYKSFGFEYKFRLATRPEKRAGTDEMWNKAEKDLEEVLKKKGIEASDEKGEGAFYGPKIDLLIKDSQSRDWQLATVQLDFHQPEAFKLEYTDAKGSKLRPVMIHRAIFGSFERFIAILTEHFQGAFPVWLSPVQAVIIPISEKNNEYAEKVTKSLKDKDIRVEVDKRSETMQAKIRDAQTQKVPYMLVVGDREQDSNQVAVRKRSGEDLGTMPIEKFIDKIDTDIESRS